MGRSISAYRRSAAGASAKREAAGGGERAFGTSPRARGRRCKSRRGAAVSFNGLLGGARHHRARGVGRHALWQAPSATVTWLSDTERGAWQNRLESQAELPASLVISLARPRLGYRFQSRGFGTRSMRARNRDPERRQGPARITPVGSTSDTDSWAHDSNGQTVFERKIFGTSLVATHERPGTNFYGRKELRESRLAVPVPIAITQGVPDGGRRPDDGADDQDEPD